MICDFVNVKANADKSNYDLENDNNFCTFVELEYYVQDSKQYKGHHRYCSRVQLQTTMQVTLQKAYETSLHAATWALNMKKCFRRTGQQVLL